MSAPLLDACATTSASGFEDGFGRRRLAIAREDGEMFERLQLRPAFSIYEQALREATSRVAANAGAGAGGRIVAPRTIERDGTTGSLVAVSPFVQGERLADLLDSAAERSRDDDGVPGMDVALGFLLQVLPALGALRSATDMSHGALAPARCVFTADGRVVLTECGFATVLQRLNPERRRLWRDFRVAMPPGARAAQFDETADISQAALAAVMLVRGRPPGDEDVVDVLPEWLTDAIEIAQIRGSVSFAVNFQRFLQRALPLPGRRPYLTLDAALQDVRQLADAIGIDTCRASVADCVRHAGAARETRSGTAAIAAPVSRPAPAALQPEAAPPRIVEEPIVVVPEEPVPDRVPTKPGFKSFYEELGVAPTEPLPLDEPLAASEAADIEPFPEPALTDVAGVPPPTALPEPEPLELAAATEPDVRELMPEAVVPVSEADPLDPAAVARRRRSRSKVRWMDSLRSAVTRTAGPQAHDPEWTSEPAPQEIAARAPAPAPFALPPPVILAPAPSAFEPDPPAPQPLAAEPALPRTIASPPAAAVPVVPEPVVRQPVFAPLTVSAPVRVWEPPVPVAAPPVAPAPKPITVAAGTSGPIKLKTSEPVARSPRSAPYESPDLARRYTIPRAAVATPRRRSSWKLAAAAAIVLVTIAAAARVYLLHDPPLNAEVKNGGPATVTAPPPVTTGTIVAQTQPEGARVLLDGSPAGETPLRIVDVAPGRHVLTFVTPTTTVKRTVKVEANKTVTLDIPVFSGWVAIFAPIVLTVSEQGRAIGTTDQGRLLLPPGRHTLVLTSTEFGYSADHVVDVEPGEVRSLNISPTGTLNLNAVPWAEVWIEGKKVGDTPLANFELPLGSREIVFKHPDLGERKVVTRVTAGEPIAVSVEFNK